MEPDGPQRRVRPVSDRLRRTADAVLSIALGYLLLIGLYGVWRGAGVGPLLALAAAFLGLSSLFLLSPAKRIQILSGVVSTGLAVLAVEALIPAIAPRLPPGDDGGSRWQRAAEQAGVPFDARSRLEVASDYRAAGQDAVVSFRPYLVTRSELPPELYSGGQPLLPLGGISNVLTVACNENGEYLVYRSDEHGFHNPPGLHRRGRVAVAALGDSMALGECVPSGSGAVARVRRAWRGEGHVLGLGTSGSGPLFGLAAFREYAEPLEPAHLLWLYYEGNDLRNLRKEMRSPLLAAYLEPARTQGLRSRQDEIDLALRAWLEREAAELRGRGERTADVPLLRRITNALLLREIRARLDLVRDRSPEPPVAEALELFRRVLTLVRDRAAEWNGRVHFVYLPAWCRFSDEDCGGDERHRDAVLRLAEDLSIPVIDLVPAFERHPDPLSLYPFRLPGHYTEEGFARVADALLAALGVAPEAGPEAKQGDAREPPVRGGRGS